ncbi:MAG: cytochrome b N-terminal domain-containing protein [Candidatus Lambdaproteobacteria bacterium]|nr:cytochrome b N-terminal domain-containing protein [Candidatus Lambdaproteobacteria bacterium]
MQTPHTYFPTRPPAARLVERIFNPLDTLCNRLYGSRYNPLYQSGTIAVLSLLVLLVTGLYLLWFYKIGAPYESVTNIEAQWWGGRLIRAVHVYAGDVMMVAVAVHALRMALRGRTWGPRVLAWISGVVLVSIVMMSSITGMVLVWDVQGQLLAIEGARMADTLPIFSEPIQRTFISSQGVPASFFFLNLILHMVFPFAILIGLWVHTLRVSRPALLPPRKLSAWLLVALLGVSLAYPAGMLPPADYLTILGRVPVDWINTFWLLVSRNVPPPVTLLSGLALFLFLVSVPWWWKPRLAAHPEPARANPNLCTGCTQCYKDCPYGAISMVPAPPSNHATDIVALINPALCVSCGICAGSCGPMVVGPPGRVGRDHLLAAQRLMTAAAPGAEDIVLMACEQGLGLEPVLAGLPHVTVHRLHCAAAVHTSAMEYLLRRGCGGVYVLACPERDCAYREGPRWLRERLYEDREAELQPRVDKRRVKMGGFGPADLPQALADIGAFQADIAALAHEARDEGDVQLEPDCEPMPLAEVAHG